MDGGLRASDESATATDLTVGDIAAHDTAGAAIRGLPWCFVESWGVRARQELPLSL